MIAGDAGAQYLQRRSINTTGAVTFTGNTLGLSKATSTNGPGTEDCIGTFISTDPSQRDGTYPAGTTGDWRLDSSAATLQLPAGSTVVYAELVWGGSYSYGGEDVLEFLDTAVRFTTPADTTTVAPVRTPHAGSGPGGLERAASVELLFQPFSPAAAP